MNHFLEQKNTLGNFKLWLEAFIQESIPFSLECLSISK